MNRWIKWRGVAVILAFSALPQTAMPEEAANPQTEYDRTQQSPRANPWEIVDPSQSPESLYGWDQERDGSTSPVDRSNSATLRDLFDSLSEDSQFTDYLADVEAYQERIDIIDVRTNEFEDLDYNWVASDQKEYGEWNLISSSGGSTWEPPLTGNEPFEFEQTRGATEIYERTVTSMEQNIVNPDKVRPSDINVQTKEVPSETLIRRRVVPFRSESTYSCGNWNLKESDVWYGTTATASRTCTRYTERYFDIFFDDSNYPTFQEFVEAGACNNGYSIDDYPEDIEVTETITYTFYGQEYTYPVTRYPKRECETQFHNDYPVGMFESVPSVEKEGYFGLKTWDYGGPRPEGDPGKDVASRRVGYETNTETTAISGTKGIWKYYGIRSSNQVTKSSDNRTYGWNGEWIPGLNGTTCGRVGQTAVQVTEYDMNMDICLWNCPVVDVHYAKCEAR